MSIPAIAAGQTGSAPPDHGRVSVSVAGGPTVKGHGYTTAAQLGFSPVSRVDLIANVERLHLPTRVEQFEGQSFGVTRGGTMTFASGEVRVSFFPPDRPSPFVLAGIGGGTSRPNVNERFPTAVKNDLQVVYFGAGARVPLRHGISLIADARMMLGSEGDDGIVGIWPIRAGLTWRF